MEESSQNEILILIEDENEMNIKDYGKSRK